MFNEPSIGIERPDGSLATYTELALSDEWLDREMSKVLRALSDALSGVVDWRTERNRDYHRRSKARRKRNGRNRR